MHKTCTKATTCTIHPLFQEQEISQEREFVASQFGDYKKMFLIVQTYLEGQSLCSPHLTPQIQCLPEVDAVYYPLQASAATRASIKKIPQPTSDWPKVIQELWPDHPTHQFGRCGPNQRDSNTSPRRVLLGLSFDTLFLPIQSATQALRQFFCLKKLHFY